MYLITTSPMDIRMVTTGAGSTSGGGGAVIDYDLVPILCPQKPELLGVDYN